MLGNTGIKTGIKFQGDGANCSNFIEPMFFCNAMHPSIYALAIRYFPLELKIVIQRAPWIFAERGNDDIVENFHHHGPCDLVALFRNQFEEP